MTFSSGVELPISWKAPYVTEQPALWGSGPVECSTETALARLPGIVWDVNGYYREIGVSPYSKIRVIREAWQAKDGHNDARLTYVFKQLNNKAIRFEYDCMPFGSLYMDRYVLDDIHKKAVEQARQRMVDDGVPLDDDISQRRYEEEIYEAMGLDWEWPDRPGQDTPELALDDALSQVQDVSTSPAKFEFAFYLWRSTIFDETSQKQALQQWQELLIKAFARRGVKTRFSVGLHGRTVLPMVHARVGLREVFFLHHLEEPNSALAERAVHQWLQDHDHPSLGR